MKVMRNEEKDRDGKVIKIRYLLLPKVWLSSYLKVLSLWSALNPNLWLPFYI